MKHTEGYRKSTRIYRALAFALALVLLHGAVVGCSGDDGASSTGGDSQWGGSTEYTVTVVSDTGAALEGVTVFVYSDGSLEDLKAVETTDKNGSIRFTLPAKDGYTVTLNEVADGYSYEESYSVTNTVTEIVLKTVLPTDANGQYGLGDMMYDFELTDVDGNSYKLSKLIKEKGTVVLNFWYMGCQPCVNEFPYLNEAYGEYKDKLTLLAINPIDESAEAIKSFADEKGLDFPVVAGDKAWESRMDISGYPTTVVIDRHGMICLVHTGSVTSKDEFAHVFERFTAEDYAQTVFNHINDIYSDSEGTGGNPTEIGGVTEFEMTVEAGKTEYCDVYKISGMTLTVESPNAIIVYNGDEYRAENGKVSLYVVAEDTFTPIKLGVGNAGDEKETFKIVFCYPEGSSGNPYPLKLGEFNTDIAEGNDQGVYYEYTATAGGTLTLECLSAEGGVEYDYILYNLDSYAQRSLSADGVEGENSVSVEVRKGDTVTVTIGTLPDSSNNYPAASFRSVASFKESDGGEEESTGQLTEYGVTVKDENGKAVKNVGVSFVTENEEYKAITDGNGYAYASLDADGCTVSITVPDGYTAESTELSLSEDAPLATVEITKKPILQKEYTVIVKGEDGKGISGVAVTVGSSFGHTDANGKAVFTLPDGDYSASISVPDGYSAEITSATFPETGSNALSFTLKKGGSQSGTANKQDYGVTVKKADGTPVSGVAVVFEKNGKTVSMQTTDSKGIATASLEKGDYTAKLAFANGVDLNYDKRSTALTAANSNITVTVAEPVGNEVTELYLGDAHHLSLGGNYGKLNSAEEVTYFVFVPERDGVYSFTTSCKDTVISYWGSNTSFIYNQTDATDYKNNLFTVSIKESNLGAVYMVGVSGGEDCVIIVKRIGDPEKTIEDLPWDVYKPEKAPESFSLGLGSAVSTSFIDVSASDVRLVYSEKDGMYHLNTEDGKVVYIKLSEGAPYLSFAKLIETSGLKKYYYNSKGECYRKEDYTECMSAYVACMDKDSGLYPLDDDLIYMIKQSGEHAGWWDKSSASYLFSTLPTLNTEIAWMFALCTVN